MYSSTISVYFIQRIIIFGFFTKIYSLVSNEVIVQTKEGPVKGFERGNGTVLVFKNVPYAKPPIEELRFELPQTVEEWYSENELNYAKEIYCPQENLGQEDCLVLDIYLRKKKGLEKEKDFLPVLIYFHPGKFARGGKDDYSSDFLLEYKDMIVVIPNYRLGILGFLRIPGSPVTGNLGLWDQRMAMQWVHRNIKAFGGDPERITIGGHGSGGSSVGFHILSPLSHDYFSAAISGTGTALDPWILSEDSAWKSAMLHEKLKCSNITCLKAQDLSGLLIAQAEFKKRNILFLPAVDGDAVDPFLPHPPGILYKMGYQKDVKYLAGLTNPEELSEVENSFYTAIKSQHLDSIVEFLIKPYLGELPNFQLITKAAKYHYLRGITIDKFEDVKPMMTQMMSDILYNCPLHLTLKLHSRTTVDTFMYVFDFKDGGLSFNESYWGYNRKKYFGLSHMKDLFYLLNTKFHKELLQKNEFRVNNARKNICEIWGNFNRFKSESPDDTWKPFSEEEMNYFEVSEKTLLKKDYKKNDMEFWTLLVPDLVNIQSINDTLILRSLKGTPPGGWGAAGLVILLSVFCIALVGVVIVARNKSTHTSIVPLRKEERKYSSIG